MPRCYYFAFRNSAGMPRILTSTVANPQQFNPFNTKFLPEGREILDTLSPDLDWVSGSGQVTQGAIALLAHATTGADATSRYAQQFQTEVLNTFPQHGWVLRADQIRHWVAQHRRHTQWQQTITCLHLEDIDVDLDGDPTSTPSEPAIVQL